ncbi:MAG: hypothetical protein C0417_08185 [Chlorobiaceae bacterium]|nr:hypothetical protein [Chlorobiaceae bacterium]
MKYYSRKNTETVETVHNHLFVSVTHDLSRGLINHLLIEKPFQRFVNIFQKSLKNIFTVHLLILVILSGCRKNSNSSYNFSAGDSLKIVQEILHHRAEVDSAFGNEPSSPFKQDSSIHFSGIKWFPPNLQCYFSSKLNRYPLTEVVTVLGTKGDEREYAKYGYFTFSYSDKEYRINVYKFTSKDSARYNTYKNYLSVWFTDETTGKETYHVGRYIDVGEEQTDPNHFYILDFNSAYNPYCAYSARYSCAIPRKEDHLPFEVRAGEMKYHD